jgi:hypothetical protein
MLTAVTACRTTPPAAICRLKCASRRGMRQLSLLGVRSGGTRFILLRSIGALGRMVFSASDIAVGYICVVECPADAAG